MNPVILAWILPVIGCLALLIAFVWISTKRNQDSLPAQAFRTLRQVWFIALVSAVLMLAAIITSIRKNWPAGPNRFRGCVIADQLFSKTGNPPDIVMTQFHGFSVCTNSQNATSLFRNSHAMDCHFAKPGRSTPKLKKKRM